tara:strand:- start:204 stop:512 length:309 start_codon:yes stop_codon:yes gene_type:complete
MNKSIYIILTLFFTSACTGLSDAQKVLRNEKTSTTDEFLVKQKEPLVLPPNFDEIPEPNSKSQSKNNEKEDIKKILKAPKIDNVTKTKSSSIEDAILERIKE